jgi:error-prone DNA polymerase
VFILLEDEFGTINLIVPAQVYERNRLMVRTEPLLLVEGKLERFAAAGGAINILVDRIGSIAAPDRILADIKDFSMLDEQVRLGLAEQRATGAAVASGGGSVVAVAGYGAGGPVVAVGEHPPDRPHGNEAEDFRAVAPAVMSFGSGRRR